MDAATPLPAEDEAAPPMPLRREVQRPRIVDVEVTGVHPDRVEVKLADGRLGVIAAADFRDRPTPSVGSHLQAALLARSDPKRVWLSYSWAAKSAAWDRLRAAKESHEPVTGEVRKVVKGGVVVDLDGVRAFLPSSLVDEHAVELDALVGTEVEVAVVDLDEGADRAVVSRREVLRRRRRQEQRSVLSSLQPGQRVTGTVVGIREFGAQVDLGGGVRGLVHRTELTWGRVGAVDEVVSLGQQLEAEVLEVHRAKRRVALSLRRMEPDPLAAVDVGTVAEAEVTRVVEYGAFARLLPGNVEGLVHISELSDLPGMRPDQLVAPGDVVHVKVIDLDRDRRRLGLSIRQALLS